MATGARIAAPARVLVAVSDERGRPRSPGLARWLADLAPSRVRGTVHVALVSDARVRSLNRRYRGVDRPTDVLSFPVSSPEPGAPAGRRLAVWDRAGGARPRRFLGDIVIARGVAKRQAKLMGHGEGAELRVLALHGLLHLLGYDHERDAGAMARVERRLRRRGGLQEGLIERQ